MFLQSYVMPIVLYVEENDSVNVKEVVRIGFTPGLLGLSVDL